MPLKVIPAGDGYAQLTEAVTTEYGQLIELVRQAVAEKAKPATVQNSDYVYVDVRGIWPDHVVVMMRGRLTSYPYTIDADNKVKVGDGAEVVADYKVVREALADAGIDATFTEAKDGSIAVTLIKAGASGNSNYYPDAALREAVPLFEGVRVFVKSDTEHTQGKGKDVRSLIGGIYGVRFVEGKTKAADTGALIGTFKPLDPTDQVVTKMTEAVRRGMQGLLGLSIDAIARTKARKSGNQTLREAVRFVKVSSVDLIVEPGAGGGLDRLVEAAPETTIRPTSGEVMLKKHLVAALLAVVAAPAIAATPMSSGLVTQLREAKAGLECPASSAELITALYEACAARAVPYRDVLNACETAAESDDVTPAINRLVEAARAARLPPGTQRMAEAQGDDAPVTRAELQMLTLRQSAGITIAGSKLPQVAKDRLLAQFNSQARFTEADVSAAITAEGAYIARFTESGSVRVPAFGGIEVGDRAATIKEMLTAFFDPAHADHRKVRSFREAYIEITGDRDITGQLADCDRGRMAESLGVMREAVDSTTFANALGNSITRRMQAIYTGRTDLQIWRRVATWGPVSDYRTQERVRIGGYGNLPAVAQGASYDPLTSPDDAKASYAVSKRGGTESVTLESITNDDVQALRRIPLELALAAGNTLMEFVFDFFRTNPTIYDTVALYHASHANLQTAALDAASYAAHRQLMVKQTRAGSNKRLGLSPKSICLPFELQETAYNMFVRGQNNDKTFVQDLNPDVIVVPYWTDPNDWVSVADPTELPALEIGFLNGREDPELFMQDMPNVGSMFSNDKLTYKIRHIYGGVVPVDGYKATTKAVVA